MSNEIIGGTDQKSENQKHDVSSVNSITLYQCPMKCEGDKTYKTPGDCPVCNMHLAPVK